MTIVTLGEVGALHWLSFKYGMAADDFLQYQSPQEGARIMEKYFIIFVLTISQSSEGNLQSNLGTFSTGFRHVVHLIRPTLIHNPTSICVPLLQQSLGPPLRHIGRIHPAARLAAESSSVATGRDAVNIGDIDTVTRVELERGLGAEDLEVDACARMVRSQVDAERGVAGVDWYLARLGSEGEAVVDARTRGRKMKGLGRVKFEWGGPASRDGDVVDGEVLVRREGDISALNSRAAREVEVGVVGHVDSRLLAVDELSLVVHGQDQNLLARVIGDGARGVYNLDLDGTRESLIPILAHEGELDALPALKARDAGDLTLAHGLGPRPDALTPAFEATMEGVALVVIGKRPGLAAEIVDAGIANTVRHAADGLAEVRAVVLFVLLLCLESLDDVDAVDLEGL